MDPHFGGQMIDTILLVSFSGSTPDIWFIYETEPFDTIRPWGLGFLAPELLLAGLADVLFTHLQCIVIL